MQPSCDRVRLALFPRLEGELDPREAADVDAHLAACDACRLESESMRAVLEGLPRGDRPPALSPEVWTRVKARARALGAPSRAAARRRLERAAWIIAVFGAFCLGWLLRINDRVLPAFRDLLSTLGIEAPWLFDGPLSPFVTPLLFILLCGAMALLLLPFFLRRVRAAKRKAPTPLEEPKTL